MQMAWTTDYIEYPGRIFAIAAMSAKRCYVTTMLTNGVYALLSISQILIIQPYIIQLYVKMKCFQGSSPTANIIMNI